MEAIRYEESISFWQPPRLLLPHVPVQLISSADEIRAKVEQFISRRFKQSSIKQSNTRYKLFSG